MSLRVQIIELLTSHRLPLSDEKDLQRAIAKVFDGADLDYRREYHLSAADVVDFMVGLRFQVDRMIGCAVEVKIGSSRRAIYRQLERYCEHEAVAEIVLATNVAMNLPPEINGRPTAIAHLARGWL